MTKKRFTLKKYTSEDYAILDDGTEIAYASNKSAFTFCELLNEFADENEQLKKEIETGKEYCKTLETDLGTCADNRILLQKENKQLKVKLKGFETGNRVIQAHLKKAKEKNEQLQKRNNRQATTIKHLYYLIENEKWEALTAIIEELNQAEEQLQKEWSN